MKKLIKIGALSAALLAASLSAQAATRCNLGETCKAPGKNDSVYYVITPDNGTKYVCELKAAVPNKPISVTVKGGENFISDPQDSVIDDNGKNIDVNGKFNDSHSQGIIEIHGKNNHDGTVKCSPAH